MDNITGSAAVTAATRRNFRRRIPTTDAFLNIAAESSIVKLPYNVLQNALPHKINLVVQFMVR